MTPSLRLVPYDHAWPALFAVEADRVRRALGTIPVAIEHVGSTAVPGLDAKPVLDIAMAVESEADADDCIVLMQSLGYEYRGPYGDDPRRRYYVRDDDAGVRVVHVHLYVLPAPAWHAKLAFRDALRADPELAAAYAAEKYRVAELVGWDKEAYSVAKGPFVQRVLAGLPKLVMSVVAACLVSACSSPPRDMPTTAEACVQGVRVVEACDVQRL